MKMHRCVWTVLPLALAVVGCGKEGGGDNAAPSATASAAPSAGPSASSSSRLSAASASAAAFAAKGMSRRHVGLAGIVLRGAYEYSLTDDQKAALEKADEQLYADTANSPWTAIKTFQTDLAAGIRATKLDNAKLLTDYAAIDKATQAGMEREAEALATLHGALDGTQRQALVEQVKARRAARERHATGPDGGAFDFAKNRLVRLTSELALEDSQQKAVAALLAKDTTMTPAAMQARRDATQKRVDTLLAEFVKDTFDSKTLDLSQGSGKTPHESLERQATFTSALLSILHPDQREKLALRAERMANRPGRNFDESEFGPQGGPDDDTAIRLR